MIIYLFADCFQNYIWLLSSSWRNPVSLRYIICKNYSFGMFLRFLPAILVYQFFWFLFVIKKGQFIAYLSGVIGSFSKIFKMSSKIDQKGCVQTLSAKEFSRKIIRSEKEVINSIISRRNGEGKNNILLRWYLAIFCWIRINRYESTAQYHYCHP